jgi:cell wall-associated NlpC family hydrolase
VIRKSVLLFFFALPGTVTAQSFSLSALTPRPSVQVTLGPISLRATLGTGTSARASRIPVASRSRVASTATATARRVLAVADGYVGIRYRYGSASPAQGFDCSGLVQYVFGRSGVALPRTSRQQAAAGRRVTGGVAALRPGDLMFFASQAGGRIDHVAIYVGDGRIIHASPGLGGVGYDDLSSSRGEWFLRRHVASRRVLNS